MSTSLRFEESEVILQYGNSCQDVLHGFAIDATGLLRRLRRLERGQLRLDGRHSLDQLTHTLVNSNLKISNKIKFQKLKHNFKS